jgi:hypothetical protein
MGLKDQVLGGRNWIQKVVEWIPGFRGYYGREHRRDADKLVREAIAARLATASEAVGTATAALAKAKRLDDVDRAGRLSQRLLTAADRARTAAQGYSGFFDAMKVREPELDRIYEHDVALLAAAESANQKASALDSQKPSFDALESEVSKIEKGLDARKEVLLQLGSA